MREKSKRAVVTFQCELVDKPNTLLCARDVAICWEEQQEKMCCKLKDSKREKRLELDSTAPLFLGVRETSAGPLSLTR